jgi:hypothetical protein
MGRQSSALNCLRDPLITPLLALLQDAVNADMRALMAFELRDTGADPVDAIKFTMPRPLELPKEGDGPLPALGCYRLRTRSKQVTFGHKEHYSTLRFQYMTPATAFSTLEDRWPLLNHVWESIIATLARGYHDAHRDGYRLLDDLLVTWVNLDSATKQELYVEGSDNINPGFIGDIEIRTRIAPTDDVTTYPILSFYTKLYEGAADPGPSRAPDVESLAFTPLGQEARDAEYADDEQELGGAA